MNNKKISFYSKLTYLNARIKKEIIQFKDMYFFPSLEGTKS